MSRHGGPGEFALIQALMAAAPRRVSSASGFLVLGAGDDAAILRGPGREDYVWTVDAQVEGVHFQLNSSKPENIGWKSLAVNLSDIAAMGARPVACLVSLAVPGHLDVRWLKRLYRGLSGLALAEKCLIAGGNLSKSPNGLTIDITVVGRVPRGKALLRSGARPGDGLYVSGPLGDAGAALSEMQTKASAQLPPVCRTRLLRPQPECGLGWALGGESGLASSMIDLSDGLSGDLAHLVEASKVTAEVEARLLPVRKAVRDYWSARGEDPIQHALSDGEDYRLLFTVQPERERRVLALSKSIRRIGTIRKGKGMRLLTLDGNERPLLPAGWDHFRR